MLRHLGVRCFDLCLSACMGDQGAGFRKNIEGWAVTVLTNLV